MSDEEPIKKSLRMREFCIQLWVLTGELYDGVRFIQDEGRDILIIDGEEVSHAEAVSAFNGFRDVDGVPS